MTQSTFLYAFEDSGIRHGGVKRSNQLREALMEKGFRPARLLTTRAEHLDFLRNRKWAFLQALLRVSFVALTCGFDLRGWAYLALVALQVDELVKVARPKQVAIEVNTGLNMLAGHFLRKHGVPYFCFPQNIEFLVPGQKLGFFRNPGYAFVWEKAIYQRAVASYAISRLDSAILACLGGRVSLLPYFPASSDLTRYHSIRKARRETEPDSFFLAVASATNPPTRIGVEAFCSAISKSDTSSRFVLVGYGTEEMQRFAGESLLVRGAVTDEELTTLLKHAAAAVIFQPQTSGFLTKIVEFNLCGVPVLILSDYAQASGLEEYGVFRVQELDDIENIKLASVTEYAQFKQPVIAI